MAELVSTYRDQPSAIFRVASAWFYFALNAAGSMACLYLMRAMAWDFGAQDPASQATLQVLVSGVSAMAILRSSFFTLKVQGEAVPIGPGIILKALLDAADRGTDRVLSASRARSAGRIMKEVSFDKSREALPVHVLALMQNSTPEEAQELRKAIDRLGASPDLTNRQKSINLGLYLMNLVGPDALESAVEALGDEIEMDGTILS
ncbi:hypothetical protein OG848_23425 [Streptomyces canus]|uniref:hypothetical protein n=1 Tax=Streptomyces canus TaxID=58343 RepID=UPI003244B14F